MNTDTREKATRPASICASPTYASVERARTISDRRKEARRPMVSATTPVGISKSTVPIENAALAMNTSLIESPASSRNSVLIPQMIEAASV